MESTGRGVQLNELLLLVLEGRAMAQAVSRQHLTTEARVRSQVKSM